VIPHFCLRILEKLPSDEPPSFWQSFVLDTSHVDLDELVRDVCEVVDGPKSTELKVWLSFVKLDDKLPTVSSVQRLLYESPEGWGKPGGVGTANLVLIVYVISKFRVAPNTLIRILSCFLMTFF